MYTGMTTAAKKPTLSPTKISTYLACPTKYYWTYIDPRGRYYIRSKSYYSFGSSLHAVLQRFHDSKDTGVQTSAEAVSALEESWIDAGYESPQEMAEALGAGKDLLLGYLEAYEGREIVGETLYVEKMFRHDLGPFILIGRVDRVDQLPDGSLEIVDYKSGRMEVCADDIRNDLAMSCYQLLLRKHHPDQEVRASILALRTGASATYAMTEQELAEFEWALQELGQQILAHDSADHVPTSKKLCDGCDFHRLCIQSGMVVSAGPMPE